MQLPPLEMGVVLHFYKFEFPLHRDALCQVYLKLAQWFWRRRFLKGANAFLPFCNYLPLGKGTARHLKKKIESPQTRMLCSKFGWNWPSGSGKRWWKRENLLTDRRSEKFTWAFSSGELRIQEHCLFWIKSYKFRIEESVKLQNQSLGFKYLSLFTCYQHAMLKLLMFKLLYWKVGQTCNGGGGKIKNKCLSFWFYDNYTIC